MYDVAEKQFMLASLKDELQSLIESDKIKGMIVCYLDNEDNLNYLRSDCEVAWTQWIAALEVMKTLIIKDVRGYQL